MLQLWKAMIYLAERPALLAQCAAVAQEQDVPHPDPQRVRQPVAQALHDLDDLLNKSHGLRLGLYELAEVNRFLLRTGFTTQLDTYWQAVRQASSPSDAFAEAAGALLMDRQFRQGVAAAPDPQTTLNDERFAVTQAEAAALQSALSSGGQADLAAEQVFSLLWQGSSCLGVLRLYPHYTHANY